MKINCSGNKLICQGMYSDTNLVSPFFTMWKFQDFQIIQILREINFGESKRSKTANLSFLGLGILLIWKFSLFKSGKIHQNSEPLIG